MNYERTNLDLMNYNPMMKHIYYELEPRDKKKDKYNLMPQRIRTWKLIRAVNLLTPDAEPMFRWTVSQWHDGAIPEGAKMWNDNYKKALGKFQGSKI